MDIINLLNCGSVKNFFRDRSLKRHFIVAVRDVMGRGEGVGIGPGIGACEQLPTNC